MALEFIETLVLSLASGSVAGYAAFRLQQEKIKKEYLLQDSAEQVAKELMTNDQWSLRSFKVIQHHLGGFEENDLRKLLVRAGAIRFMSASGVELWGLLERNRERLGVTRIQEDPANMNDENLFTYEKL